VSKANKLKQQRNSKTKDIFDRGNKFVCNNFIAFFLSSDSFLSFIIASKKIGNAVKRNHSKRRLRELVRLKIENKVSPIKLVLLARGNTSSNEFSSLLQDCDKLINKINNSCK